jgi:hypothetical protein
LPRLFTGAPHPVRPDVLTTANEMPASVEMIAFYHFPATYYRDIT